MIQTKTLVLDILKDENEDDVISILSNYDVKQNYISYDLDYDGLKKKFKKLKLDSKIKIHYARAIFKDNKLIGIVNDVQLDNNQIEIELALLPEYQKADLIQEILEATSDKLLNKKGFKVVKAYCFEDYVAYKDALKASGFTEESRKENLTYRGLEKVCLFFEKKN